MGGGGRGRRKHVATYGSRLVSSDATSPTLGVRATLPRDAWRIFDFFIVFGE